MLHDASIDYNACAQVTKLITRVEDIFTKHFSHHDRRKAMAQLRPMQQHGGHTTTFFLGE
jgi:hypothetical protein